MALKKLSQVTSHNKKSRPIALSTQYRVVKRSNVVVLSSFFCAFSMFPSKFFFFCFLLPALGACKTQKRQKRKRSSKIFSSSTFFFIQLFSTQQKASRHHRVSTTTLGYLHGGDFSIRVLEGFARLIVLTLFFFFPPRSQRKIENTPRTFTTL